MLAVISLRVIKMWNASGNKWYNLDDVSKTLRRGDDTALYALVAISQLLFVCYLLPLAKDCYRATGRLIEKVLI